MTIAIGQEKPADGLILLMTGLKETDSYLLDGRVYFYSHVLIYPSVDG